MQLLGLRTRESYLDPQLIHAFEEISGRSPLEDGFTKQAEQGRAVILEEAVGELRRRRSRNSPVDQASQGFLVEWGLLPGTLALLQEVEDATTLIWPVHGLANRSCVCQEHGHLSKLRTETPCTYAAVVLQVRPQISGAMLIAARILL